MFGRLLESFLLNITTTLYKGSILGIFILLCGKKFVQIYLIVYATPINIVFNYSFWI